jgi:hypothetical protein
MSGSQADYFAIDLRFWTIFIVGSQDPRVIDSDFHYTERAVCTWSFKGSGVINSLGDWTPDAGDGVFCDHDRFVEITEGVRLPQDKSVVAANYNDVLARDGAHWHWDYK